MHPLNLGLSNQYLKFFPLMYAGFLFLIKYLVHNFLLSAFTSTFHIHALHLYILQFCSCSLTIWVVKRVLLWSNIQQMAIVNPRKKLPDQVLHFERFMMKDKIYQLERHYRG